MYNLLKLYDFIEINPRMKLEKGKAYQFVDMGIVEPGNRYVKAKIEKEFNGGGAKFQSGDTLFARITPCLENGKIAQFQASKGSIAFGSTEFFVFRNIPEISDPGFVYYLAKSDLIRKPAEKSMAGASGRQRADIKSITNLEIPFPPLFIQIRIASILSTYDDLIENNTRRIQVLEEMAQRIYTEWFVYFRFPGHEKVKMVDSELGRIPNEWEIRSIKDTFSILGGGTPSKKKDEYWVGGTINWYTPSDLTKSGNTFMDESISKTNELGLKKSSAKLFPAYSVMMTSRATLGVVAINTTDACTNQGFITCLPNNDFPVYFMFQWIKANVELFIGKASGTTFKEITKGVFKEIPIVVPENDIVEQFEKSVSSFMELILCLQRKNENLRQTRDLLLRKLISGDIDVSEMPDPKEAAA